MSTLTLAELLRDAIQDWRSGRAFVQRQTYYIYALVDHDGSGIIVVDKQERPRKAPWSDAAREWFGAESSERLHRAASHAYPYIQPADAFSRLHGLDSVRPMLLREIYARESVR